MSALAGIRCVTRSDTFSTLVHQTNARLRAIGHPPLPARDWWQFLGTLMLCDKFKDYTLAFETLGDTRDASRLMPMPRFMCVLRSLRLVRHRVALWRLRMPLCARTAGRG